MALSSPPRPPGPEGGKVPAKKLSSRVRVLAGRSLKASLAVFPLDGAALFAIDALRINVYPRHLPAAGLKAPSPSALEKFRRARGLAHDRAGNRVVLARRGHAGVKLYLGATAGGERRRFSATMDFNILSWLREEYEAAGVLRALARDVGSRPPENLVDPARLLKPVNVHADALALVAVAVDEARAVYAGLMEEFWGWRPAPSDVGVSLNQVELTWDVACRYADLIPTQWWPAWRSAFRGAGRRSGFFDADNAAAVEASESIEPGAVQGTPVFRTGYREGIRADTARGNGAKLYVKDARVVRFEAEFTGDRARRLLGHSVRLGEGGTRLGEDLERLAAPVYRRLLEAQETLTAPVLDFAQLIEDLMGPRFAPTVAPIVRRLLAGHKFHNVGERCTLQLHRLRRLGYVRHLGRGDWAATPKLARTFDLLRRLAVAGGAE